MDGKKILIDEMNVSLEKDCPPSWVLWVFENFTNLQVQPIH